MLLQRGAQLWLGRNRIDRIAGLDGLAALRQLSLQSNRLTSMAGLAACTALEELYLSHNGITRLEGLESLARHRPAPRIRSAPMSVPAAGSAAQLWTAHSDVCKNRTQ